MRQHPTRWEKAQKKVSQPCQQVRLCRRRQAHCIFSCCGWGLGAGKRVLCGVATCWSAQDPQTTFIQHWTVCTHIKDRAHAVAVSETSLIVSRIWWNVDAPIRIWGFALGFQRPFPFIYKALLCGFQLRSLLSVEFSIKGHKLSFNNHTLLQNKEAKKLFFFFPKQFLCNTSDRMYIGFWKMWWELKYTEGVGNHIHVIFFSWSLYLADA